MDELASIAELVNDMSTGAVDMLLMLGGNPVYDAPADLNFLDALKKVKSRAHVGTVRRMKPRHGATGTCRRRIISNPGAMRGPMTARLPSFSR